MNEEKASEEGIKYWRVVPVNGTVDIELAVAENTLDNKSKLFGAQIHTSAHGVYVSTANEARKKRIRDWQRYARGAPFTLSTAKLPQDLKPSNATARLKEAFFFQHWENYTGFGD